MLLNRGANLGEVVRDKLLAHKTKSKLGNLSQYY